MHQPDSENTASENDHVLTQDGHLSALRANDGFTIWSVALHATDFIPPVIVTGEVIYVGASDNSVYALHQTTGSVIWHHQGREGESVPITVAQSVIYFPLYTIAFMPIVSIIALRASDGFILWSYTPHTS